MTHIHAITFISSRVWFMPWRKTFWVRCWTCELQLGPYPWRWLDLAKGYLRSAYNEPDRVVAMALALAPESQEMCD